MVYPIYLFMILNFSKQIITNSVDYKKYEEGFAKLFLFQGFCYVDRNINETCRMQFCFGHGIKINGSVIRQLTSTQIKEPQ